MDYKITHQPEQKLFKTEVDGRTAFVEYRLLGDYLDIIHTIVPKPIEGCGIAAASFYFLCAIPEFQLNFKKYKKLKKHLTNLFDKCTI